MTTRPHSENRGRPRRAVWSERMVSDDEITKEDQTQDDAYSYWKFVDQ